MPASTEEIIKLSHALLNQQLIMDAAIKRQNELKSADQARLMQLQNQFFILFNFIEHFCQAIQNKPIDKSIQTQFKAELNQLIIAHQLPIDAINSSQSPYKSLLEATLDNQNFKGAYLLLDNDAIVGSAEREAFKIAINSEAGRDFGFRQQPTTEEKLHTVKKYGLILGLEVTAKDGTFSQKSYLGPALSMVADSVEQYAKTVPNDTQFQKIASAFKAAEVIGNYQYSEPLNKNAGNQLFKRIQQGDNVTSIPIRCKGHTMGLSVISDKDGKSGYLAFTNRGFGAMPHEYGTKLFKIDDLSKLDVSAIETVMSMHGDKSYGEVMQALGKLTGNAAPVHFIAQPPQTMDDCTVVNPSSNIQGMLIAMKALETGKEPAKVNTQSAQFNAFDCAVKTRYATELATQLQQNPQDQDLQNLAKAYAQKYPNIAPDIEKSLAAASTEVEQSYHSGVGMRR